MSASAKKRRRSAPATSQLPVPVNTADRIAVLLASFGFCGFFPVAPATFASAVTALILAFVLPLGSWLAYVGVGAALLVLGGWSAGRLERIYGHDPSAAVIDEVLGMWITLAAAHRVLGDAVPATVFAVSVIGFFFFRFFDIAKVYPGRLAERCPGGWGVMLDDVVAGVYAALALLAFLWFWPAPRFGVVHLFLALAVAGMLFIFRQPLQARYGKKRLRPGVAFGRESAQQRQRTKP